MKRVEFMQETFKGPFETLIVDSIHDGKAAKVVINRPSSLNALNRKILEELRTSLTRISETPEIRVVTIEGAGEKAFVAGADIVQMRELDASGARQFALLGQEVTTLIEFMPQIVIAKVRGFALGGGCELAMACDILLATNTAKFGQPEVNLGLIPGFGGTQRLASRVGLPVALDMICSGRGRTLKADEALNAGLVSRVIDSEKMDAEAHALVESILAAGPESVRTCKRLVRESLSVDLAKGLRSEANAFVDCWSVGEAGEGMSAFLEKRAPAFDSKRAQP